MYSAVAISAMPSGTPWWPSPARTMASMERKRIALASCVSWADMAKLLRCRAPEGALHVSFKQKPPP